MSHNSFNHSDTIEGGIQMFASQVLGSASDGAETKFEKLYELIKNKNGQESMLVLCDSNKVCRKAKLFLLGKQIKTSLFLSEIPEDKSLWTQEKDDFHLTKLAMCSYSAFADAKLPLVENYILLELPSKKSCFPKTLDFLEKFAEDENRIVRIEIIVFTSETSDTMKVLNMEMSMRKSVVPLWLAEYIAMAFAPRENREQSLNEECQNRLMSVNIHSKDNTCNPSSTDTSCSPGSSFLSASAVTATKSVSPTILAQKRNNAHEKFDVYNMKPNAEGKYIVPQNFVGQEHEQDDDDYMNDGEISLDEDYDYDALDNYEDMEHEYYQY